MKNVHFAGIKSQQNGHFSLYDFIPCKMEDADDWDVTISHIGQIRTGLISSLQVPYNNLDSHIEGDVVIDNTTWALSLIGTPETPNLQSLTDPSAWLTFQSILPIELVSDTPQELDHTKVAVTFDFAIGTVTLQPGKYLVVFNANLIYNQIIVDPPIGPQLESEDTNFVFQLNFVDLPDSERAVSPSGNQFSQMCVDIQMVVEVTNPNSVLRVMVQGYDVQGSLINPPPKPYLSDRTLLVIRSMQSL